MQDHIGGAYQAIDFRDASDIPSIPFDPEFEILVGIEALRVYSELSHDNLLVKCLWGSQDCDL
jgi:hypothetical protein